VRSTCLLCDAELTPGDMPGQQLHPEVEDCLVRVTDAWGVSIDDHEPAVQPEPVEAISLQIYPLVEDRLLEIFARVELPRLGGASSGRGWSSFSTFQRCPHAWYKRYVEQFRPTLLVESPSLTVGTLVHTYLAVHYARMMDPAYPLTPDDVADQLIGCNPQFLELAWRVFSGYRLYYSYEVITPLAVEYDLRDPRTGESTRYDLVAYFPEGINGRLPGTYIVEHKTASRFDADALEGWANDGEILGEVALWKHLGLDRRFGPLQGVLVNLLGKQKDPQYHRTLVAPTSWKIQQHLRDLTRWEGLIQLARSTRSFPRARQGCIGRYGRCDYWDHCLTEEDAP